MILEAARKAAGDVLAPDMRPTVWKSLGLTVVALVAAWFAIRWAVASAALPWLDALLPDFPAWAEALGPAAGIAASIALAIGLAYLVAPAGAVVAGLFLDDVAERVEARHHGAPGRAMPLGRSVVLSVKFFGVVVLGNLLALALLLVPGVNLVAFFSVNAYLLSREFFEFAAMRHRPEAEARALRQRHAGTVWLAGVPVAAMLAVPLLNLLAPFFAAALMVHLHAAIARREAGADRAGRVPV